MCDSSNIEFAKANLREEYIKGKSVIEVGSLDVNGSLRSIIEAFEPTNYTGVDLSEGPGVDIVCHAEALVDIMGPEKFDLLISTEMMEHVLDWKKVISNFKKVLKPEGILLITTRSKGFFYHAYPHDFWRYESEDMTTIFSDFKILAIEKDPNSPGIFIMAQKPKYFIENDLSNLKLYSVVKFRRTDNVKLLDIQIAKILYSIKHCLSRHCPDSRKNFIKKTVKAIS